MKRRLACLLVAAAGGALVDDRPVFAFDPLLTQGGIPSTPGASLMPETKMCVFGVPGNPMMLMEAVERALCYNPKTREAWADVKARAAAVGVARAAYLPTVSGNWQGVRDESLTNVTNHPELSSNTAATVQSESVSLNWVLYDFGGRSAALSNASALFAAAKATQDATLQQEFATVAKDYYAAEAAQGAQESARVIERTAQQTLVSAQARVERGVAPVTDALQAQTQHDEAVFNMTKVQGESQAALGVLASDLGLAPDAGLQVPAVTATPLPTRDYDQSVSQLIAEVKHTHPNVLAAEAQYDAAIAKVAQTRAGGLPSISLVAKYSRDNQRASLGLGIPTYPATGRDAYVGVQVTIPFFEGFGRHYQVRQAEAEAERQQAVAEETVQQVALDVWNSWQALRTATQNAANSEGTMKNAQLSFDAARHRYEQGVGNILELLNTQTALANAQQRRVQALADWHTAKLRLASTLGRLEMKDIGG